MGRKVAPSRGCSGLPDPRKTLSEPPESPQAMDVDELPEAGLPANGTLIDATKSLQLLSHQLGPLCRSTMHDAGLAEGNGAMSAGGSWQNADTGLPGEGSDGINAGGPWQDIRASHQSWVSAGGNGHVQDDPFETYPLVESLNFVDWSDQ